ncbi:SIS domain-containing protein [Palleronia abyssalis]|uniref:Glutamine--fructose-6-phosphate aminotransferase [isomerizing] n=1 Tax=Palleronia abyssalis TaxID=1501240 RepID=A0A2R8BWN1_9RHOB|nr:SIS domain-containing protein [Palleronia abyssalis]SPJ24569.1 HTH-type transcriptional regulator MurR [Palleronia abyssalis]
MTPSESHALMRRELDEQPCTLAEAAAPLSETAARIRPPKNRTIWLGGCGDSLFAAQSLTHLYRAKGWTVRAASAAQMLWSGEIEAGDTVVAVSISGSTRRTIEAVASAGKTGARTVAVTLKTDSALARTADDVLPLPYEPVSRAIPHGLDYHVTLLALAALAGEIDGPSIRAMFERRTEAALDQAQSAATDLSPEARFFFLGGDAALGSAGYGAAKLHEAGGLPAWTFEAENFAHGAQFMLRPGDHAVLCGSGHVADSRTLAMKDGLRRLGLSVSHAGFAGEEGPLLVALEAGLFCQTLCLALAEARGLDVTDPARGSDAGAVQNDWFGWTAS